MKAVFFLLVAIFTGLYTASRKKYDDFIDPIDKRRYPLKAFIPVGLYMLDISGYKYATPYDKRLLVKICELSGVKYSHYYLRVHWANKLVYVMLSFLFIALVGAVSKPDGGFLFFSISLVVGVLYITDNEINEKIKKRRVSIRMDFPDFINKLTLLINAGMTISRAWEKIVTDDTKGGTLYDELCITLSDIRSGKPEQRAYEDFAKRCRTPEITRFVSVILQNLRKGNSEMVSILRVHANECWDMRKNTAKKLGEEASTKMLLPMMLMFLAILLIVGAPAVLSIRGI
jgi:tight adherence protein C